MLLEANNNDFQTIYSRLFSTESISELQQNNKEFQQQLMGKYALYVLSKEKRYSAAIKGLGSMEDASSTWLKESTRLYPKLTSYVANLL